MMNRKNATSPEVTHHFARLGRILPDLRGCNENLFSDKRVSVTPGKR